MVYTYKNSLFISEEVILWYSYIFIKDISFIYLTKTFYVFIIYSGSLVIEPTRYCTHFFKIVFIIAVGGFYSYYIHQGNRSDKERKIVRKKFSIHTKQFITFFKISCGCNSTFTIPSIFIYLWRRKFLRT